MKKICLLSLLIAISVTTSAQISVGLKTGMSLSDYTVKSKFDRTNKSGVAAGVVIMNTIGKNVGIQADIMYVQKGYNIQICNQCYEKFTSSYLEVPLAMRYSFYLPKISAKLENLKAHAVGGIYFSRWLNANYETKIFENKITQDYEFTGEKRADFGPNFGAGLEYALFSGSLLLDYRYSYGMVDMSAPGSKNAQKNRSSIISLTFMKSF